MRLRTRLRDLFQGCTDPHCVFFFCHSGMNSPQAGRLQKRRGGGDETKYRELDDTQKKSLGWIEEGEGTRRNVRSLGNCMNNYRDIDIARLCARLPSARFNLV